MTPLYEPLETRTHFAGSAASSALDPDYLFASADIRRLVGRNANVFQAVPAPGDRTYLLAERYENRNAANGDDHGFLTIIAVTADGDLDTSFGTGGAVLSGRMTQKHYSFEPSGILRLDDAGRLYFADDTRVMRFRANGSADTSFGTRGVASFASDDQSVALCDITPVDDGVLIATTKTAGGVQRFAVQKVDRRVRTVFESAHVQKGATVDVAGTLNPGLQNLRPDSAQFAQSRGGVVLARVETDFEKYPIGGPDFEPGTTAVGATFQRLVVTRFDSTYHGTDSNRIGLLRPPGDHQETDLGSLLLSANGRVLTAETGEDLSQFGHQILRFNLTNGTAKRFSSPAPYDPGEIGTSFRLLPDGEVGVFVRRLDATKGSYTNVSKYLLDGTRDSAFADEGVLTVRQVDYSGGGNSKINQFFLGASGRLYFLATGNIAPETTLTLRRV